jgi:hypothetical protein
LNRSGSENLPIVSRAEQNRILTLCQERLQRTIERFVGDRAAKIDYAFDAAIASERLRRVGVRLTRSTRKESC